MPLEIDYRPVIVPPPLAGRRDRAPAAEGAPEAATVAQARADVLQQQARLRDALLRRARWRWRLGLIALVGVLPALLAVLGWGDPRGIGGALAKPQGAVWHQTAAADGARPVLASARDNWDQTLATVHSDADIAAPAGPSARPLLASGSGLDHARALQCLTAAIYYEAAREPDEGQRAVAQVVLNRVAHPAFPKTVCGVVYQGSERPGCQFSFACDGSMARAPMAAFWLRARRVAEAALAGSVYAPIGLATHYHTSAVHPGWADSMTFLGTIGAHRFYRWSGAAGTPRAFNAVYAGGEPLAAPHPRTWVSTSADFADPLVLERAFEAGRLAALRANPAPQGLDPAIVRAGPAFGQQPLHPALAPGAEAPAQSHILAGSGAVRPEAEHQYDSAAHWIRQPGS
jgi:spore germination cell wall hydrolase CwlJ-like protein